MRPTLRGSVEAVVGQDAEDAVERQDLPASSSNEPPPAEGQEQPASKENTGDSQDNVNANLFVSFLPDSMRLTANWQVRLRRRCRARNDKSK